MNKHCYKVIFSRTLNQLIVVCETAIRRRKDRHYSARSSDKIAPECFSRLVASILMGLSLSLSATAGIVADTRIPKSQQVVVLPTKSGAPQININTPSAAGISVNQYAQFDVDGKGAILANNRKPTQTQIAGWVNANPNMIQGEASAIVNQVNAEDPSYLNGYIEIAGRRADVIIANPSGISINGGGFLNASKAILTTGKVNIQDGELSGIDVERGDIRVSGQGFDSTHADYTALISRTAHIQSTLSAGDKKLDIITSKNHIDTEGNIRKSVDQSSKDQSTVSIDVSNLGGMYAGSIRLVATEKGVGVNNAGKIQSQQLSLSADGKLTNSGDITSKQQQLSSEEITNTGNIAALDQQTLSTRNLTNNGTLFSGNTTQLKALDIINTGKLQAGKLNIQAQDLDNAGRMEQTHAALFSIRTKSLDNRGSIGIEDPSRTSSSKQDLLTGSSESQTTVNSGQLNLSGTLKNTGRIVGAGEINLYVQNDLSNQGELKTQSTTLASGQFDNSGKLSAQHIHIDSERTTNSGSIISADDFTLNSATLTNAGTLTAKQSLYAKSAVLTNRAGASISADRLTIDTNAINNQGNIVGKQQQLSSEEITNTGNIAALDQQTLSTRNLTNNGTLFSGNTTQLKALDIINTGKLQAGKLNVQAQDLDNAGRLEANSIVLDANIVKNHKAGLITGQQYQWQLNQLDNQGEIRQSGTALLAITTQQLDNYGILSGFTKTPSAVNTANTTDTNSSSYINVRQQFNNQSDSLVIAENGLNLVTTKALNNYKQIQLDTLRSSGESLKNQGTLSVQHAAIATENVRNDGNFLGADIVINSDSIDNLSNIASSDRLDLNSVSIGNIGQILSQDQLIIRTDQLNNAHGKIAAAGSTELESKYIDNQQGTLQGGTLNIKTEALDNKQGKIFSHHHAILDLDYQLDNQAGVISGSGELDLKTQKRLAIQNKDGIIESKTLNIAAQYLTGDGNIRATEDLSLDLKTDFTNYKDILAGKTITLNIGSVLNNHATIHSAEATNIYSQELNNQESGNIFSSTDLTLQGETLTNRGQINSNNVSYLNYHNRIDNLGTGKIFARDLLINTPTLTNRDEITLTDNSKLIGDAVILSANGTLTPTARGILHGAAPSADNLENAQVNAASIVSRDNLIIGAQTVHNIKGILETNTQAEQIQSAVPLIQAGRRLSLGAHIDRATGEIQGHANALNNIGAKIESGTDMQLDVKTINNNNTYVELTPYIDGSKTRRVLQTIPSGINNMSLYELPVGQCSFDHPNNCFQFGKKDQESATIKNTNLKANDWFIYDYNQLTHREKVKYSQAASIIAGGDLDAQGHATIHNRSSQILLGGTLNNIQGIEQSDTLGETHVESIGNRSLFTSKRKWYSGKKRHRRVTKNILPYHENSAPQEEKMALVQYRSNSNNITLSHSENDKIKTLSGNIATLPDTADFTVDINRDTLVQHNSALTNGVGENGFTTVTGDATQATLTPSATGNGGRYQAISEQIAAQNQATLNQIAASIYTPSAQHIQIGIPKADLEPPYTPAGIADNPWLTQNLHKRLGDGYYEQQLIREQIAQLSGRRFIHGYSNDLEQYKALLNNGAVYAKQFNLAPGVALSDAQMQQLTTDLVWLVNEQITLPDGRQTVVTVPKVYLKNRVSDIDGNYTHISAENISTEGGKIDNGALLNARNVLDLKGTSLKNTGTLNGKHIAVDMAGNIDNSGGQINGRQTIDLHAGGDIKGIAKTTHSAGGDAENGFANTQITKASRIILSGGEDDGPSYLQLSAGNNIKLDGAQLRNDNTNSQTVLYAQGDINLGTVETKKALNFTADSRNYSRELSKQAHGSEIESLDNLSILAEGKIHGEAAQINSLKGDSYLQGEQGVKLSEGRAIESRTDHIYTKSNNVISSESNEIHIDYHGNQAIASNVTGNKVTIIAGETDSQGNIVKKDGVDLDIVGSNVVSDHGTRLASAHDINIDSAKNYYSNNNWQKNKKSGLMSAGIGFSIGKQQAAQNTQGQNTYQSASMVGAIDGNVLIDSANHYQQNGSIVHAAREKGPLNNDQWLMLDNEERARAGNLIINAQSADIAHTLNSYDQHSEQRFKKSGLTVSLGGAIIGGLEALAQNIEQIKAGNGRVSAMAGANAAWNAYLAGKAARDAVLEIQNKDAVNISITIGRQQKKQQQQSHKEVVQASQATADGSVLLTVRGKDADSTLNVTGSDVGGSAYTRLDVTGQKTIQAAKTNNNQHSQNQSHGWNAGVSINVGQGGYGLSVTASGNTSRGRSDGESSNYRLSHLGTLSGQTDLGDGKTTLIGAQILGKGITGKSEDLTIISPQETSRYDSKQQNTGAQVTVGTGFSASADYSRSKINADHQSINAESGARDALDGVPLGSKKSSQLAHSIANANQDANTAQALLSGQSGIYAGDDGYQLSNTGTTTLIGGIITSTSKAEADDKNRFITDRIVLKNLDNYSNYKGTGFGIGLSYAAKQLGQQDHNTRDISSVSKSLGYGKDNDQQSTLTRAGINTVNLSIKDDTGQRSLSGQSAEEVAKAAQLNTSTETAQATNGALFNTFDANKVQKNIDTQVAVTKEFDQTRQSIRSNLRQRAQTAREAGDFNTAKQLEELGIATDMLAGGLYTPSNNALGTIANTIHPAIAYKIGQYAKANSSEGTIGHSLNHAALAAVSAYLSGNDALSSALAAGGAESAAPLLAQALYAKDVSQLSAQEKDNLASLAGILGSVAGAVTNTTTNTIHSTTTATIALENNALSAQDEKQRQDAKWALPYIKDEAQKAQLEQRIRDLDLKDRAFDLRLSAACSDLSSDQCQEARQTLEAMDQSYNASAGYIYSMRQLYPYGSGQVKELLGHYEMEDAKAEREAYINIIANNWNISKENASRLYTTMNIAQTAAAIAGALHGTKITVPRRFFFTSNSRKAAVKWGGDIMDQGKSWEQYLARNLPKGTEDLNKIKSNFKTFDFYQPNGTAISAKTMDTVRSKTYQNPNQITSRLNKYVDDMVNFDNDGKGRSTIDNEIIKSKELHLAVPRGTTEAQYQAIQRSVDYAESQGVKIIVKEVN